MLSVMSFNPDVDGMSMFVDVVGVRWRMFVDVVGVIVSGVL